MPGRSRLERATDVADVFWSSDEGLSPLQQSLDTTFDAVDQFRPLTIKLLLDTAEQPQASATNVPPKT